VDNEGLARTTTWAEVLDRPDLMKETWPILPLSSGTCGSSIIDDSVPEAIQVAKLYKYSGKTAVHVGKESEG
jgi:hypothetical protein